MKKKLLSLENLKVKSFVTSFNDDDGLGTIKGGFEKTPYTKKLVCTASGVCVCNTEVCETEVYCDVTNDCPIIKQ
jgi:hypothetical protein